MLAKINPITKMRIPPPVMITAKPNQKVLSNK